MKEFYDNFKLKYEFYDDGPSIFCLYDGPVWILGRFKRRQSYGVQVVFQY